MSGYSNWDGDTAAVKETLDNVEGLYREYRRIIGRVAWFDEDDNTWEDVEKAADEVRDTVGPLLRELVESGELRGVDLDSVDWVEIVKEELNQTNLDEGRAADAGLDDDEDDDDKSLTFTMSVRLENDAFAIHTGTELARILRKVADQLDATLRADIVEHVATGQGVTLFDVNGARVGEYRIEAQS